MKWRIWLLSLGITIACLFVFAFASTQLYYKSSVDDSKKYLQVYMNEYNESYTFDEQGAKSFSSKLNGARVTFMDSQGNVLADSIANNDLENHSDRSEIKDAILNGEGFAIRGSSTLDKNMIYFCKKVNDNYLIRIAVFTDSIWTIFVKTLPILLSFSAIIIILCVFIAIISTHFILTPVKQLATEASENCNVKSKFSELEPIANILNERNRNIQKQMNEIEAERNLVEKAHLSKDEFISNVTHEMNTPLTSIHGYAELLQAGVLTDNQQETAFKTILIQSERLTNLIACIINYSELDTDDLPAYEVDFSSLAKEILSALKPEADKKEITIIEKIDDNVIIMSRHERLNEIFGNLARNAIKYNKYGGSIIITLNCEGLIVEDTGIGISEENMPKVFSRFFTVDKSHNGKNGGFGLGLAVVKKICQISGWQINVESIFGEGSKFIIRFDNN